MAAYIQLDLLLSKLVMCTASMEPLSYKNGIPKGICAWDPCLCTWNGKIPSLSVSVLVLYLHTLATLRGDGRKFCFQAWCSFFIQPRLRSGFRKSGQYLMNLVCVYATSLSRCNCFTGCARRPKALQGLFDHPFRKLIQ
jgi:hypothetical protein